MRILMLHLVMLFIFANVAVAETSTVYTERDLEKYRKKGEAKSDGGLKKNDLKSDAGLKRITVDFKDADLLDVLRMLADIGNGQGYDVHIDPAIKGKTTIYAKSMLWTEVIDLLTERHNLDYVRKDRTIFINRK